MLIPDFLRANLLLITEQLLIIIDYWYIVGHYSGQGMTRVN